MQLTGEDHGGTLRGFASFYMEDQEWTAATRTLGHADEKISTALAPRRADDTSIVGVFLAGMTAGGFLFAAYRGQPTV
jgi:hypothetical protein